MTHRKLLLTTLMMLARVGSTPTPRPFVGNSQFPGVMNTMFKLQQVKANILRALNMTSPPRPGMPLPHNFKATSKTPRILEAADRQQNVSILLSESAGSSRPDTISFRFDSRLRAHVQSLETVLLILFLHVSNNSGSNISSAAGLTTGSQSPNASNDAAPWNLLRHNSGIDVWTNDSRDAVSANNSSSRLNPLSSITATNVNGNGIRRKGQVQPGPGGRPQRTRALKKQSRVKITLKVVDQQTGRKRKIGQEHIIVKDSTTTAIPVPVDVIVAAASSPNHTLILQVSCRRCKGQVEIEKVYTTFTRKNNKPSRRINPNRPYLFIKMGSNMPSLDPISSARGREMDSHNEISRKRSRRKVPQARSTIEGHTSVNTISPCCLSCCSQILFFSFEELDLKFIIFPKGLSTVVCSESCSTLDGVTTSSMFGAGRANIRTRSLEKHLDGSLQGSLPSEPQLVRRKQELGTKSTQTPTTLGLRCQPGMSRPLPIVYLDRQNQATFTRLDNVVHESYVCSLHM